MNKKKWYCAIIAVFMMIGFTCYSIQNSRASDVQFEPMIAAVYQPSVATSIKTQRFQVYFRTKEDIQHAEVIDLVNVQGENLADPVFHSGSFQRIKETQENEIPLYELYFQVHGTSNVNVHISKLKVKINDEVYLVDGEYKWDSSMPKDEQVNWSLTPAFADGLLQITSQDEHYLNHKILNLRSSDERIEITSIDRDNFSITPPDGFKHVSTTLQVSYEEDGIISQKWMPWVYHDLNRPVEFGIPVEEQE